MDWCSSHQMLLQPIGGDEQVLLVCCNVQAQFITEHILKPWPIAVLALSTFHCLWAMICCIYLVSFFYTLGYQHELNGSEKWFTKMWAQITKATHWFDSALAFVFVFSTTQLCGHQTWMPQQAVAMQMLFQHPWLCQRVATPLLT